MIDTQSTQFGAVCCDTQFTVCYHSIGNQILERNITGGVAVGAAIARTGVLSSTFVSACAISLNSRYLFYTNANSAPGTLHRLDLSIAGLLSPVTIASGLDYPAFVVAHPFDPHKLYVHRRPSLVLALLASPEQPARSCFTPGWFSAAFARPRAARSCWCTR